MRITIKRDTVAAGRNVFRGETPDVPEPDAHQLLRSGKAVPYESHHSPEVKQEADQEPEPAERKRSKRSKPTKIQNQDEDPLG